MFDYKQHYTKTITDASKIQLLSEQVKEIVEHSSALNEAWYESKGFVAVPVESACHFDRKQAVTLSKAMIETGYSHCNAVATEPLNEDDPCFIAVRTSAEGLLEFSDLTSHFNYVLIPDDATFAVLCTTDDFFVICGEKKFVNCAVGGDIGKAREEFDHFASGSESWKNMMIPIADKYKKTDRG